MIKTRQKCEQIACAIALLVPTSAQILYICIENHSIGECKIQQQSTWFLQVSAFFSFCAEYGVGQRQIKKEERKMFPWILLLYF
jgi:hypothetical protein